jgi:hypothetical protein
MSHRQSRVCTPVCTIRNCNIYLLVVRLSLIHSFSHYHSYYPGFTMLGPVHLNWTELNFQPQLNCSIKSRPCYPHFATVWAIAWREGAPVKGRDFFYAAVPLYKGLVDYLKERQNTFAKSSSAKSCLLALINSATNHLAVNLLRLPDNRRLRRYLPIDLPDRF